MLEKECTCPHCLHPAPQALYENVGSGMLRCRTCRTEFEDPDAYRKDCSYADCDSLSPVTRFPYSLSGKNVHVRVPKDYMAYLVGNMGSRQWLKSYENVISDQPEGFQLYYVCLRPRVQWGTRSLKEFGAYGTARLSVSREYVLHFCESGGNLLGLEHQLKSLADAHITSCVQSEIAHGNIAYLEHRSGYSNMLGVLAEGVHLISIDPKGFRNADGFGSFPVLQDQNDSEEAGVAPSLPKTQIDLLPPSRKQYTVRDGTEEVFIGNDLKTTRHKAGEIIDPQMLTGVVRVLRFHVKEFSLPCGWGVFNQPSVVPGFFSSYGTVSFYVDSTELLARLACKTRSWEEFEAHFFDDVFRKEVSAALRNLISLYVGQKRAAPGDIARSLSPMSVDLASLLNGEDPSAGPQVFRQYGLRINRIDILQIDFYTVRR